MTKKVAECKDRLTELMNALGIAQIDVCKKTGLSKAVFSMYVNGKRIPRQDKIALIADAYNVDPAWLIGYDVPMYRGEVLEDINTDYLVECMFDDETKVLIETYKGLDKDAKKQLISYMNYLKAMN